MDDWEKKAFSVLLNYNLAENNGFITKKAEAIAPDMKVKDKCFFISTEDDQLKNDISEWKQKNPNIADKDVSFYSSDLNDSFTEEEDDPSEFKDDQYPTLWGCITNKKFSELKEKREGFVKLMKRIDDEAKRFSNKKEDAKVVNKTVAKWMNDNIKLADFKVWDSTIKFIDTDKDEEDFIPGKDIKREVVIVNRVSDEGYIQPSDEHDVWQDFSALGDDNQYTDAHVTKYEKEVDLTADTKLYNILNTKFGTEASKLNA